MMGLTIPEVFWLPIIVAVATGCRSHQTNDKLPEAKRSSSSSSLDVAALTRGIEDPDLMAQTILAHVPAGTSIDQAQKFMEREGFRCSRKAKAEFAGLDGRMDYLYCDRSEEAMASVARRWQVALIQRDGKVVDVIANTGLVGP